MIMNMVKYEDSKEEKQSCKQLVPCYVFLEATDAKSMTLQQWWVWHRIMCNHQTNA